MKLIVATSERERAQYEDRLREEVAEADLPFEVCAFNHTASEVDVIIFAPDGPVRDFSPYTNLKLIQSIWAGVDAIIDNETIKAPLCRLVDDGLRFGMREYVCAHILADHQALKRFEDADHWDDRWLPLAQTKTVGIIGAGGLGIAVADALSMLGFNMLGWSRSKKELAFPCFNGEKGLKSVLGQSDYIVTLLPHTAQTEDIVNADFLNAIKPNAMLINPGRGALVDENALLAALDTGKLRRAVLDVFKTEPLPLDHPFWAHDRVLVTPHIAAKSRLETASKVIIKNLRNLAEGRDLVHLVDRALGY